MTFRTFYFVIYLKEKYNAKVCIFQAFKFILELMCFMKTVVKKNMKRKLNMKIFLKYLNKLFLNPC